MVVDAQTVKQAVIAIINLQPNGLPADELNEDYKKIEGSDIPFRSMGYNSLLKFIEEELKERVRIERQVETNEVFLFPIATGYSRHIVELIKGEIADKSTRRKRVPMPTSIKETHDLGLQKCGQRFPNAMHYLQGNNPNWALQMSKTRENQLKIIKNYEQFGAHKELCLDDLDNQEHTDQGNKQGSHINKNQFYRKPKMQGPFRMQRSLTARSTEARHEYVSSLKKQYQTGDYHRGGERYYKRNNCKMSESDRLNTNYPNDDKQSESVEAAYVWEDVLRDIDDLALSVVDDRRNIDKGPSPKGLLESCIDNGRQASFSCASAIINHVDKISFSLTKNDAIELAHAWKELSVGDQLECTLEEINNPLKFWLRMKKDEEAFNTLSQHMNTFYNRHAMKLELWDDDLDEHELFACCYENRWYRVRAENRLQDSNVQVRFVDFGSREVVKMKKLRRLPSEFMKVPILAICSALGNIRPIGQYFTATSAELIINLTEKKDLIAKVLNIDRSKMKIMVELKIKENLIDVSESLVQDGHATFRFQK